MDDEQGRTRDLRSRPSSPRLPAARAVMRVRGAGGSEVASGRRVGCGHRNLQRERHMAKCEVCGNDYYLSFEVITAGQKHVFDSFECAIHKLAPICNHCGCKIIGHGIEANGTFYCCASCAHQEGATKAADNV
jgi:hypothetical protein